jgi:tRNA threonylcarbamoyl adenosine modification protein YeaZ/ribosomal-protein-alanine acetyltransferase
MSSILVIDTSTDRTSVGLVSEGVVVLDLFYDDPLAHGEVLPQLVEQVLANQPSIDLVAIAMGPGPFTGLRVGIAFGQAFAQARNIPWVGNSSLAAMAKSHSEDEFIVAIDARRREFFCEHYRHGNLVAPARTLQREELAEFSLPIFYEPPTVAAIAELAQNSTSITEPIYIRKPDAYPAPKGVTFRPWTYLDLVDVYALEKQIYRIDPWSMDQFKEEFAGSGRQYLVAEYEGKVVGYAGIMVVGEVTDILTLTVAPEFRRRGIARELLKRMIDWSRNKKVEAIMLEMRVGNVEAEPLYLAHGFRQISFRKDYYGPGIHAAVMRKELRA